MDRSEEPRDEVIDPPTAGTQPAKTGEPAGGCAVPSTGPAVVTALELPRPYAVASARHTLPPVLQYRPVAVQPQPPPTQPETKAAPTFPAPLPLVAVAYRVAPQPVMEPVVARVPPPAPALELPPVVFAAPVVTAISDLAVATVLAPEVLPPSPSPATSIIDTTLRVDQARRPAGTTAPPAAPVTLAPAADDSPAKTFVRKALRVAGYTFAGYMALVLALIVVYRFVNPPLSSLMLQQRLTGQDILQDWVSLDAISPQIVRAVLVSEDGRFCQHHGIDVLEMQAAIERAQDGIPRGASTISMQLTKNLFLWPSKSYIRKAIEIPLTLAIELLWPKWRIMEVYLNIAEWGPGIFGVESASRFYFDKAARRLNEREAAQLAVALPNPISRDPGEPGRRTQRLASDVQDRMRATPPSQTACILASRRGG